jgi:hypothetical protein
MILRSKSETSRSRAGIHAGATGGEKKRVTIAAGSPAAAAWAAEVVRVVGGNYLKLDYAD